MKKIRFACHEHEYFFYEMLEKSGKNDSYHRAFFYCMGIAEETRANINRAFSFQEDCIEPDVLHDGWQTGSTMRLTRLAFNLWNGYTEQVKEEMSAPYELFDCGFAPYFYEAIKQRYPEYCRDLSVGEKNNRKMQEAHRREDR